MHRVVKVGGSLLLRPDLIEALREWIDDQPPARTVLIFGGGEVIDAIRRLDRLRPGESQRVHWRCVDLLQATFETAAEWFPDWDAVDSPMPPPDQFWSGIVPSRPAILSVRSFYRRGSSSDLPCDWRTTTDAILAELAIRSEADQAVILKSCPVDPNASVNELAQAGIVDPALPLIADQVKALTVTKLPLCSRT